MSTQIMKFVTTPTHHLLGFNTSEPAASVQWYNPENRYFAADSEGVIHRVPLAGKPECDPKLKVGPVFRSAQFEKLIQSNFCDKCFSKAMVEETLSIAESVVNVMHHAA